MRSPTRRRRCGLAGVVLAVLAAGGARAADASGAGAGAAAGRAGFEDGRLHELREDLADLLPLKFVGGRLALDRDRWSRTKGDDVARKEVIEKLVKQYAARGMDEKQARRMAESMARHRVRSGLRGALRNVVSSGSFSMSTSDGQMSVRVSKGSGSFSALMQETAGPGRILHFRSDAGRLRIMLVSPETQFVLLVAQDGDGTFRVLDLAGDAPFRARAKSFEAFCRTHRAYAFRRLLPLLTHNGVGVPPPPHGEAVRGKVLAMLRNALTPQKTPDAAALIAQLDDSSYAKREQATRRLAAEFGRCHGAIEKAAADESLSLETRMRLKKILADAGPHRDLSDVVAAYGLLEDPTYLVELLAAVKGPDDRKLLAAQLAKLTGRDFGTDVRRWRQHLAEGAPATRPSADP